MRQIVIAKIVIATMIILNISLLGILVPLVFSIIVNHNALYKQVKNMNGNYTLFHLKLWDFECNLIEKYVVSSDI